MTETHETLVVDLDGTLLRSDMLLESFWSAFSQNWRSPVLAAAALFRGKAALKRYLAEVAEIDVTTLPYDPEVVAYVKAWRASRGKTALVTASDQQIANEIAAHLELFDEVHGSNGSVNLKGPHKAGFLDQHFGQNCYAYMGDSPADLAVWGRGKRAITVNASAGLRRKVEKVAPEAEHLTTRPLSLGPYIKALRPHQWIKNVLVFLPMLAAHEITGTAFFLSFLAFVSFSLIAASVYVLNDLLDLDTDRTHPRKCRRPFASGSAPLSSGTWMAAGSLCIGAILASVIGGEFFIVMAGYYILTIGYSLHLKRRMVVDICTLAGLYTIRIIAGATATGIPLSVWLLAFSVFFFLSLAAVKRQAELVDSAAREKLSKSGRGYHANDLPIISMVSISAGFVAVLVMALYVNAPSVVELYSFPQALWGVCVVLLYWIMRTVMIAHRGEMHDDPVVYAVKDRISQVCFLIILIAVLAGAFL